MRGRAAQWLGHVLSGSPAWFSPSLLVICKRGVMIAPCSSKRPGRVQNATAFLFRCEHRLRGCGRHGGTGEGKDPLRGTGQGGLYVTFPDLRSTGQPGPADRGPRQGGLVAWWPRRLVSKEQRCEPTATLLVGSRGPGPWGPQSAPWRAISLRERGLCGSGTTVSEVAGHTATAAFASGRSAGKPGGSVWAERREVLQSWTDTPLRGRHGLWC